jgi:ribosomal protein L32E
MGPATRNSGIYNVVVSNPDEFAHMEKSGSLASLHAQQDAKKKAAAAEAAKEE